MPISKKRQKICKSNSPTFHLSTEKPTGLKSSLDGQIGKLGLCSNPIISYHSLQTCHNLSSAALICARFFVLGADSDVLYTTHLREIVLWQCLKVVQLIVASFPSGWGSSSTTVLACDHWQCETAPPHLCQLRLAKNTNVKTWM